MSQVVPIARVPAVTFGEMQQLAESIAKSGLFGMKKPEEALALMAIAQAEGRHPALAARDYDIIKGKAAKKAEAMMRDFLESGGNVKWHALDDTIADATFAHPAGGTVRIMWDMPRVKTAGISNQDMYRKYPRQMLRSRCVSEGVRTVCPAATSGMYVPEEIVDFEVRAAAATPVTQPPPARLGPPSPPPAPKVNGNGITEADERALDRQSMRDMRHETPDHDPETGEIIEDGPPAGDEPVTKPVALKWRVWYDDFIAKVAACDTSTKLSRVLQTNDQGLDACESAEPELGRLALQAYRNRAALLAQGPV